MVRLFAQTEITQQRAGQDTTQWQGSLAGYLMQIAAAGQQRRTWPRHLADQGNAQANAGPADGEPRSPCSSGR